MILLIIGTNRRSSKTALFAKKYQAILEEFAEETIKSISIEQLQDNLLHSLMYEEDGQSELLKKAQDELFIPAQKWIIISPEYNGSYPGVFKLLLDALSTREAGKTFHNKKVALVGISSGRIGNWLGMNQLTAVLNYLKMHVYHNKLAVSNISNELDEKGELMREKTSLFIRRQIKGFLNF
jgi:NAD(P)H-dependent FMN reductase